MRSRTAIQSLYENYFRERISKHGDNVESLWNSEASQRDRFRVLVEVGDLTGSSILDVGCGFGDLIAFMLENKIPFTRYLGLDISESALDIARRKFPGHDFHKGDIFEVEDRFDYVFASGIFFLQHDNWAEYCKENIQRMYWLCTKATAVNFLSRYGKANDELNHFANPARVLELIQTNITEKVLLRHEYRKNDFTLYIYK